MKVIFCGRLFGTASGWDQVADQTLFFYDFKWAEKAFPADKAYQFECDGLEIDYERGVVTCYAADGLTVLFVHDIVGVLNKLERA